VNMSSSSAQKDLVGEYLRLLRKLFEIVCEQNAALKQEEWGNLGSLYQKKETSYLALKRVWKKLSDSGIPTRNDRNWKQQARQLILDIKNVESENEKMILMHMQTIRDEIGKLNQGMQGIRNYLAQSDIEPGHQKRMG